jgi:hypothetical protein
MPVHPSRLARSSADWHRLLDLCRLTDVPIIDEQAVYTPRDYNDRLLLGLKGTMSEAEQYWMRLRLDGGRLNKARRGQYRFTPPAGYIWDKELPGFRLDPDEEVQRSIGHVFQRFRLEKSAYGVMRYLARAAAYRIGRLYRVLWEDLLSAPVPPGLDDEERAIEEIERKPEKQAGDEIQVVLDDMEILDAVSGRARRRVRGMRASVPLPDTVVEAWRAAQSSFAAFAEILKERIDAGQGNTRGDSAPQC